jgi:4-amino-4-deoxy-L-arabinose transferase-like glycosyltransferase
MPRYFRPGVSLHALCPTCGERVIGLRWNHEERCSAWHADRRRRSLLGAAALLVAAFLAFVAFPARAQSLDPAGLQQGFTTAPLATSVVVLLVAVFYLFRELRAVERARIEDLTANFERLISMGEQVAKLSNSALESVSAVEELGERNAALLLQLENERARRKDA